MRLLYASVCFMFLLAGCAHKKTIQINSLDDLRHARIGVLTGSTGDLDAQEAYPEATILRFDAEPDLYLALQSGKVDGAVVDGSVLSMQQGRESFKNLGVVRTYDFGVAFNKANPQLRESFNSFLAQMKADGTHQAACDNWFGGSQIMPDLDVPVSGTPIRVVMPGNFQGFGVIKDGQPAGFDVEIAKRFANSLGRPLEIQYINFGGLIAALVSGKADMICAGLSITEERLKIVDFSDPYFESNSTVIAMPGDSKGVEKYSSLEDASKARFAVVTGNLHDRYVSDNFPKAKPQRYDNYVDVMASLDMGKSDVGCLEGSVYDVSFKRAGKYEVIGRLFDDPYGAGFNKDNPELLARFNEFLSSIKADGTYALIESRWIENFETAVMPDLGAAPAGKALIVGCTGATDVFDFFKDGRNAGFDIEIAERFGRYIGRPVEFRTINFGGLIAALSSGTVDMIISAITINEERAKKINFSEPYFVSQSIAVVLKERFGGKKEQRDGSDIASARVAVMTGTIGEMEIAKSYPQAEILLFDDINDAIMSLTAGKSDYVVTAFTTATEAARNNPQLTVLPKNITQDGAAVAINRNDRELLGQIDGLISQFKADGTMDEIISHWIKATGEDYEVVDLPEVKTGKPIRAAVSANRPPVSFIYNGQYAGIDAELIKRISIKLGRPIEIMDMKFSGLIAALETGRADIVISNIFPTPERALKANFTQIYLDNPQVMLTVKADPTAGVEERRSFIDRTKESFYNNLVLEKRYQLILKGLQQTVIITFFAAILGTIFGGVICALRMSRRKLLNGFARAYINIMRGTPVLVLLMLLFYVVFASSGLSATAVAIFTFALNMAAYASEMFRTAIQGVDPGQREAGIALGFTKTQTFINIIFPQAVKTVVPVYKGEVISMLKMTSVVGYVAVMDLTKASDIIRSRTFDAFFPLIVVAVVYIIAAWMLGMGLDYINRKISSSK